MAWMSQKFAISLCVLIHVVSGYPRDFEYSHLDPVFLPEVGYARFNAFISNAWSEYQLFIREATMNNAIEICAETPECIAFCSEAPNNDMDHESEVFFLQSGTINRFTGCRFGLENIYSKN